MSGESMARPQPELAQPDPHPTRKRVPGTQPQAGWGSRLPAAEPVPRPEVEDEAVDVRLTVASQRQLVWWRFKKHKVALASAVVLALLYLVALFAEPVAPYDPQQVRGQYKYVQPVPITFVDGEGNVTLRPGVNGLVGERDPDTLRLTYLPDPSVWYPVQFFVRGSEYKLWGLFESDLHLVGLGAEAPDQTLFLLGTDRLGRDVFSRIVYGARLSLSIGLVGVGLSFLLGISIGGVSGYYGGWIDMLVQRVIEFLRSIPRIPLWMALAAAVPPKWPIEYVYFAITIILSLIQWTGLARVVRGRFLSLREEDFVLAARLAGASQRRIIFRHMLPSFTSHIIASLTLAIPGTILGETGLSFLGLGLREPAISWGVLLQDAQSIQTVALSPWLMLPAVPLILTIMAFNFLGDGLRDAADPYGK
ncbi:MAG TPA: ABC transporter permease [Chloroflexota bacterium]|jgi:peptide/nickel transport system permease protein|nr:ABC transporter permease [Chloroflexota bacterium]